MINAQFWMAVASTFVALSCRSTPEQDLKRLGSAVKHGDSASAVKYIDIDRTTKAFVDDVMNRAFKDVDTTPAGGREPNFGQAMGAGMMRMMLPAVQAMVNRGVYDLVSGRPIRRPESIKGGGEVVMPRDSILKFRPLILGSNAAGDTGWVKVQIHPLDGKGPIPLNVHMERAGKVWRVVRVDGLASVLVDSAR